MQQPTDILERYWGFTEFKGLQEDIIASVLNNEDTLALLPTAGGKTICFQVPAMVREGICIVVSPLIALMNDQVNSLKQKGIKAMALTSKYSYDEVDVMLDNCVYGHYKFLYLSPERLQQDLVQNRIRQMNVNLIAVDEAHCISQWGNDFRPAYKNIHLLRELHPHVNIIALTASATPKVVDDMIDELNLVEVKTFRQSFNRDNLAYMVFDEEDKNYRIEQILRKNPESSIIYVRNRKRTVELQVQLNKKGFSATYYHGGLDNDAKEAHLKQWMTNRVQVMVATNAFGMGIDKPDVRTVIHINLPESVESYFQEAGRAGRDQKKAFAVILKNKADEDMVRKQFLSVLPSVKLVKKIYRKLCNYFQLAYGEGVYTTHDFNLGTFCRTYNFNPVLTYNALQILDRTSVLSLSRQFHKHSKVQILAANEEFFQLYKNRPEYEQVLKSLLRTYGGILDHEIVVNTALIADKSSMTEKQLIELLKELHDKEIIALKLWSTDAEITFLQPREDDRTINPISGVIQQQNKLKTKQVQQVIDYVNNIDICKSEQLLTYFGETEVHSCGICSVCISSKTRIDNNDQVTNFETILKLLKERDLTSRAIAEQTEIDEVGVTFALKILLEHRKIALTKMNTYKLID